MPFCDNCKQSIVYVGDAYTTSKLTRVKVGTVVFWSEDEELDLCLDCANDSDVYKQYKKEENNVQIDV